MVTNEAPQVTAEVRRHGALLRSGILQPDLLGEESCLAAAMGIVDGKRKSSDDERKLSEQSTTQSLGRRSLSGITELGCFSGGSGDD